MSIQRIPICRHCLGEKIRVDRNGHYSYHCPCQEWKEYMVVLDYARKVEAAGRPRRRSRKEAG